jgi:hypothetical protein
MYHLKCLDPPLEKVPRGKWYCPDCCVDREAASGVPYKIRSRSLANDSPLPILIDSAEERSTSPRKRRSLRRS